MIDLGWIEVPDFFRWMACEKTEAGDGIYTYGVEAQLNRVPGAGFFEIVWENGADGARSTLTVPSAKPADGSCFQQIVCFTAPGSETVHRLPIFYDAAGDYLKHTNSVTRTSQLVFEQVSPMLDTISKSFAAFAEVKP